MDEFAPLFALVGLLLALLVFVAPIMSLIVTSPTDSIPWIAASVYSVAISISMPR